MGELERRAFIAQAQGVMTTFALAARQRMEVFGTSPETFGRIAQKSKQFGALNPNAHIRRSYTLDEIMNARLIADPLTLPMCCPNGDGGAAVVLASKATASRIGSSPLVKVRASTMFGETYEPHSGFPPAAVLAKAAVAAYETAAVAPADVDIVQLHDATASEELEYYEALALCGIGEGDKLVIDGATGLGGSIPVNTDGGLQSRGHPLGPTGCAQIHETVLQLRGTAGPRQVEGAKLGLVQMTGAGDVYFINFLERVSPKGK
jgi:acetyl-CoA acetyltransferase